MFTVVTCMFPNIEKLNSETDDVTTIEYYAFCVIIIQVMN